MNIINENLRRNNFVLLKANYEKSVWKGLTRFYKDNTPLDYEGIEYILIRSDCKNYMELVENDVGNDYSIGLSSCDDECSSIGSYDSDRDSDWEDF